MKTLLKKIYDFFYNLKIVTRFKDKWNDKKEQKRYEKLFEAKSSELYEMSNEKKIIIFSSDCVGGRIMKDFKLPCYTPTVNIGFRGEGFLKVCKNPEYYFSCDIEEDFEEEKTAGHPVGRCGDVCLYFGHETEYKTAEKKWKRGCKQYFKAIKTPHEICVIMTDRNCFSDNMIERFEILPYKYKVIFTHKKHENAPHEFYMVGEDKLPYVEIMTKFENVLSLKRRYDRFDFFAWFKEIYSGGKLC